MLARPVASNELVCRIQQVESNAQRSVLAAQQAVAELRGQLEQTIIDNQVLLYTFLIGLAQKRGWSV